MRVVCIDNTYQSLTIDSVYYPGEHQDARFSLHLDSEYIVYAIWIKGSEVLYFILEDERASYAKWFPSVLFQVVDGRMPSCWRYGLNIGEDVKTSNFLLAFSDWMSDPLFNENLVDGDPSAREVWERYRRQIASESIS